MVDPCEIPEYFDEHRDECEESERESYRSSDDELRDIERNESNAIIAIEIERRKMMNNMMPLIIGGGIFVGALIYFKVIKLK